MGLVLVDTNIVIDYLNGYQIAADELAKHQYPTISIVTWIEVLAGTPDYLIDITKTQLNKFAIINCTLGPVAEVALAVRRGSISPGARKIKLPDAIIFASASLGGRLLLTRNIKDFKHLPNVLVPYELL